MPCPTPRYNPKIQTLVLRRCGCGRRSARVYMRLNKLRTVSCTCGRTHTVTI